MLLIHIKAKVILNFLVSLSFLISIDQNFIIISKKMM
jgi:hypothetical protein